MFPILYENIKTGYVPMHNGLGILSDCTLCEVEQARNGIYELMMEYPASGIHADQIALRRILKVKANFTDNPQLFRIDRIGKTINGKFTVYGKHISYDLSGFSITSGTANNAATACTLFENATKTNPLDDNEKFTIRTTKETVANFRINMPSSVKSWFVGKEGSFVDVFGGSDIKYDNFRVDFLTTEVKSHGVTIKYSKNLLELSQEMDCSNLYTDVMCYYNNDGVVKYSNKASTGLTLDVPRCLIIDVTSDYETEPTPAQLNQAAQAYVNGHNLTVPDNNITLDFVQSGNLKDRVDLNDTVTIYYEALGISTQAKCIRTKWDCLREKYIETEFGDIRQDLTDTLVANNAAISNAVSSADAAITAVASKKRVFIDTPIPPYDVGDLWVNDGEMYVCHTARPANYVRLVGETTTAIEDGSTTNPITVDGESYEAQEGDVVTYNGDAFIWMLDLWTEYVTHIFIDWELATNYADKSDLEIAIANATEAITGIAGGLVILHDTNNDGSPDEIIITNDNDFHSNTAKLWRWNAGGLGYSTTGYDGEYETAITIDPITGKGQINADLLVGSDLNAQTAGIQNLTATMFTGNTIALGGTEESKLVVLDSDNNILIQINRNGMECFGEETGGVIPSVVFDKNGVTGYSNSADKANTAIFWTHADEFHMKNCVVENEINTFGKIKVIPMQITSSGSVVNDGIGFVAIV